MAKKMTKEEALEKIEELKKFVEDSEKSDANYSRYVPKENGEYWYIDSEGDIMEESDFFKGCDFDDYAILSGNCFKTEEEAEQHLENIKTKMELIKLSEELNEGKTIDFTTDDQTKYYIQMDDEGELEQEETYFYKTIGNVYCLSDDFKRKAINKIGQEKLVELFKDYNI